MGLKSYDVQRRVGLKFVLKMLRGIIRIFQQQYYNNITGITYIYVGFPQLIL